MVFTREKNDTSNQNGERCFFTCEKNDTQCSPYQAVTGKIYRLKKHFLPPETT